MDEFWKWWFACYLCVSVKIPVKDTVCVQVRTSACPQEMSLHTSLSHHMSSCLTKFYWNRTWSMYIHACLNQLLDPICMYDEWVYVPRVLFIGSVYATSPDRWKLRFPRSRSSQRCWVEHKIIFSNRSHHVTYIYMCQNSHWLTIVTTWNGRTVNLMNMCWSQRTIILVNRTNGSVIEKPPS